MPEESGGSGCPIFSGGTGAEGKENEGLYIRLPQRVPMEEIRQTVEPDFPGIYANSLLISTEPPSNLQTFHLLFC